MGKRENMYSKVITIIISTTMRIIDYGEIAITEAKRGNITPFNNLIILINYNIHYSNICKLGNGRLGINN